MAEESGEKTEEPTPHKLQEARKKGQIAKGKELTGAILLFVAFYTLQAVAGRMWLMMVQLSQFSFERIADPFSFSVIQEVMWNAVLLFVLLLAPLFAATFVAALVVEAFQTGFLFSTESLTPDLKRINPFEGIKKFFSLKQYVETVKSVIKMTVVIWVIYKTLMDRMDWVLQSQGVNLWTVMQYGGDIVMTVIVRVGMLYLAVAMFDYFYQRYEFLKSMRMSKKEIKEEYKRLEGDPMIKQRQRDAQREMAMGRQMGAVPGADVVVTNPIHFAIAIQYKSGEMRAPVVVAKGQRLVAREIRSIAEAHYIPIIENPPLAQILYKTTRVGSEIPSLHYRAVAEILAFVYNLKKKRKKKRY